MMPPEQSVEYRAEPPPMNQDFSMPPEQFFDADFNNFDLESMGDFDFGPADAGLFGDHWATAGQDEHHVLTEQSFSTQDQFCSET